MKSANSRHVTGTTPRADADRVNSPSKKILIPALAFCKSIPGYSFESARLPDIPLYISSHDHIYQLAMDPYRKEGKDIFWSMEAKRTVFECLSSLRKEEDWTKAANGTIAFKCKGISGAMRIARNLLTFRHKDSYGYNDDLFINSSLLRANGKGILYLELPI